MSLKPSPRVMEDRSLNAKRRSVMEVSPLPSPEFPSASGYSSPYPPIWRKLLWVKQPFPDNYVDDSFLSQLKRNSNVQQYRYWTLAADSSVILVHLCTVVIFACVFLGIYNKDWDASWFAGGSTLISIAGYAAMRVQAWHSRSKNQWSLASTIKSSLLILLTLFTLSPILKSLTQSTSSDSIWSLSCWLCMLNVLFHDYSYDSKKEFKQMLSTNLALSAAIVLASRLMTSMSVFCFVLFSIQIFGLLPTFALWVRTSSKVAHLILVATLVLASDTGLYYMSGVWTLLVWILVQALVIFVFPGWFLGLQKYKNEIEGPWDPARPVLRKQ